MKGFIKTLEAVLASLLLLTSALIFAPQISQSPQTGFNNIYERLSALEKTNQLNSNVSRAERNVENYLPPELGSQVSAVRRNTTITFLKSNRTDIEVPKADGRRTQVFNQNGVTRIKYNSSLVLETRKSYEMRALPNEPGNLSISASGNSTVIIYDSFRGNTEAVEADRKAVFPIIQPDQNRILRVEVWRR